MFELTGFQRDLLWEIAAMHRPSGQQIKERVADDFEVDINHGRLYPNLDTLVDKGYVQKGEHDRRTNFYQVTESGLKMLDERLEWEKTRLDAFERTSQ